MQSRRFPSTIATALFVLLDLSGSYVRGFLPGSAERKVVRPTFLPHQPYPVKPFGILWSATVDEDSNERIRRVPVSMEGVPIPFVDVVANSFIECYADSIAKINGVEYTIGVPCDNAVALCYFKGEELVPIELDEELMDDVFSIAEGIVADEFGEELVLQRTPQTLTLVGELEDDNEGDDDSELDDEDSSSEEVEVLLTFEHRGTEYHLARLLDPILLVGKADDNMPLNRVLLSPEEADAVMPVLEELFLEFHDGPDSVVM